MRRRIEGVVPWLDGFDEALGPGWWQSGGGRLDLCPWRLEGLPGAPAGPLAWPDASREGLARMAPYWARFDVCLLPVIPATLAWSRLALATAAGAGLPPVVILARGLSASAVADLMRLEVEDFVIDASGVEECWIRVARRLARRGGPPSAPLAAVPITPMSPPPIAFSAALQGAAQCREPFPVEYLPATAAQADPQALVTQWMGRGVRALLDPELASRDFRETRGHVVAEFEREYVTTMLHRYGGNVSQASRAGHITRRTFWRLMRKFDIDSATYRQEVQLRQIRRWRALPLKSGAPL